MNARLLPLAMLFLCSWGAPLGARADTCAEQLACVVPVRLFPEGMAIPGNSIYFKVASFPRPALELRTDDGELVPSSMRMIGSDLVFAPDAELPAGLSLALVYTTVCPYEAGLGPGPQQETFAFTTRAPMAIRVPDEGELTAYGAGREELDDPAGSVIAAAEYRPPYDESVAHLLTHHATIDSYPVGFSASDDDALIVKAVSSCEVKGPMSESCGPYEVDFGRHRIAAWTTVVGAETQPHGSTVTVTTHAAYCQDGCSAVSSRAAAHNFSSALLCLLLLTWRSRRARQN